MILEIVKNIETPNSPDGGDYTIIKAGEAVIGFTFSMDPQSHEGTISPCIYRKNGTRIHSVHIQPITVTSTSVVINGESILEKDAYDTHLTNITPGVGTLDLILRTRVGAKPLSEYVSVPAQGPAQKG